MIRSALAALAAAALFANAAGAETFRVFLGARVLGTVTVEPPSGGSGRLATRMTNTPLGVGDGSFEATVTRSGGAVRYRSVGRSPGETRTIGVEFERGRAVATDVRPASEATPLSDPGAVPGDVLDLVSGVARLADARDCPKPFRMYDGRRVVRVATAARAVGGGNLTCEIDYRVVAGPGHLSPLRFKSVAVTATYALSGGEVAGLAGLRARAGVFAIRIAP